jgi:hypothetical protein
MFSIHYSLFIFGKTTQLLFSLTADGTSALVLPQAAVPAAAKLVASFFGHP